MRMDDCRSKTPKHAYQFNERSKICEDMNSTGERGEDVDIDIRERFGFLCEEASRTRDKDGSKLAPVKMRHGIQRDFLRAT